MTYAPSEDSDQPGHSPRLCAQWVAKDSSFLHARSEDSDQTGWMPRLIRVFAGRNCLFVGFVIRRLIFLIIIMKTSNTLYQLTIWIQIQHSRIVYLFCSVNLGSHMEVHLCKQNSKLTVRPKKKNICVFQRSALKKPGMVGRHNILFCQNILYRNCIFQYIFPHFLANLTFCSQFTIKCLGSGQKPR